VIFESSHPVSTFVQLAGPKPRNPLLAIPPTLTAIANKGLNVTNKFRQLVQKYSVLICIVISLLFLGIAVSHYPGGSIHDKTSVGFDWSKNFFSNLFLAKALNGAVNPSRIWALIGMVFNSIGYGLFFIHTVRKIPHNHTRLVLKSIGVINMCFKFLAATSLHDIMVTV
jgi:hypothetical protein